MRCAHPPCYRAAAASHSIATEPLVLTECHDAQPGLSLSHWPLRGYQTADTSEAADDPAADYGAADVVHSALVPITMGAIPMC